MAKPSSIELFKKILSQNWLDDPNFDFTSTPPANNVNTEFAQYLLTHSYGGGKPLSNDLAAKEGASSEEPSLLNKIFNAASAPMHTAYSVIEDQAENLGDFVQDPSLSNASQFATDPIKDIFAGLLKGGQDASQIDGVANISDLLPQGVKDWANKEVPNRYGADILGDLGVDNPIAKFGGGFALDVATDPLTYVPGLNVLGIGKKAVTAGKALEDAAAYGKRAENFIKPDALSENVPGKAYTTFQPKPEVPNLNPVAGESIADSSVPSLLQPKPEFPRVNIPTEVEPALNPFTPQGSQEIGYNILNDPESLAGMQGFQRSDNARRAANIRHHGEPEPPRPMTAVDKADFADFLRDSRMAKRGKVTDGKGNVSAKAITEVIEDIKAGNLPRFAPKPMAASGIARDKAVKEADDFLTNNLLPASGKKRIDLNPANQANLYNRMFSRTEELVAKPSSKKGMAQRRVIARQMLRTAEDHMIRLGKHPQYWNGMRVRLSDVLEEVGMVANDELATKVIQSFVTKDIRKIKDPVVVDAINKSLARRSMASADLVQNLSKKAAEVKQNILDNYSPIRANKLLEELPQQASAAARVMGMSEGELNAVIDQVRNIVNIDKIPVEEVMNRLGNELIEAVASRRVTADVIDKINKAMVKSLNTTPERLANNVTGIKSIDGFMLRLATWYGRGEMKNFSQDVFTWGEMNAVMRARTMRNMVKNHSRDEINAAFRVAQGMLQRDVVGEKEALLSDKFLDYFENMLGSSGFKDLKDAEGTVAVKSLMTMADVNKHLKAGGSKFFFINKKATNIVGQPRDYSEKGVGWMKSWENADPKKAGQDPVSFMYDLDLAIEKTVKESALVDEFAMRFGARPGQAHFDPRVHTDGIAHHRLQGFKFPKDQRDAMIRLLHDVDEGIWMPQGKPMQFYSRGLRAWKTGVTIYMPSHHIRNMIGDLHLMWWAGHNDPRNFFRARRVMHSQRTRYQEALKQDSFDAIRGLVDKDAMEWAKTQGTDVILKQNGHNITADEIYIAAHQHGLLLDANKLEDIFGQAPLENIGKPDSTLNKVVSKPLGGHGHQAASTVAEYREHYVRLSHFIAAVNKGLKKSKDLQKVYDDAAHEVRKWHPDGRDMTNFEAKWMKNMVPFYSWTRKALPLIVQTAVTRPAKILYYPRAQAAFGGMMGIEGPDQMLDPFPENQLFPEWIRAKGIGPTGDPQSENAVSSWWGKLGRNMIGFGGKEEGYTIVNPSNPFNDVVESIAGFSGNPFDVGRSIFDSSTPAAKIPAEIFIKGTKFSGAPIAKDEGGEGILPYLLEQVPILSAGLNVAELGKEPRAGQEGSMDMQALLNYLTAAGVRGTGPYEKSAEFEVKNKLAGTQ